MGRAGKYVPRVGKHCPKNYRAKRFGRNKGKCTTHAYAAKKPCSVMTERGFKRTKRCVGKLKGRAVKMARRAREPSWKDQGYYTFADL